VLEIAEGNFKGIRDRLINDLNFVESATKVNFEEIEANFQQIQTRYKRIRSLSFSSTLSSLSL
jgi:hypothetical protein